MKDEKAEIPNAKSGMSDAEIESLVAGSFLRRVPDLVAGGLSMDEAIQTAFDLDFSMLIEMQLIAEKQSSGGFRPFSDKERAYAGLIDNMCLNVWQRVKRE